MGMMKVMHSSMPFWPFSSHRSSLGSSPLGLASPCGFRQRCIPKQRLSSRSEIKQRCGNCPEEHRERGTTTIELIVVLGIIALIGTAVFSLSSASIRAMREAQKESRKAALLLRCDTILRNHLLAIRVPFWVQDMAITNDDTGISIPYYQAGKDKFLKITRGSGALMVKAEEKMISISGVEFISAVVVTGKQGEYGGLDVLYSIDGTEFHTIGGFGATTLFKRR